MSAITISGDLAHYEVLGRGKPVILLHSWLGSWRYWIPTMQQLGVKYRTYALDLWGFGDSGRNKIHYGLDGQVEMLRQFIDRMGIPKAVFVGHGLGAAVIAQFATMPECKSIVHRMMVISPPLFGAGFRSATSAGKDEASNAVQHNAPTIAKISKADRERLLAAAGNNDVADKKEESPGAPSPAPAPAPPPSPSPPPPVPEATPTPSSSPPTQGSNPMVSVIGKNKPEALLTRHMDTSSGDFEKLKVEVAKADEEAMRTTAETLSKFNPLRNLLQVQPPTLALMGEDDTFVAVPDETILQQLSDREQFKLIVMSNTRHFPMLEDTTRFIRLVREFMEAPDISTLEMKDEWRRRTR